MFFTVSINKSNTGVKAYECDLNNAKLLQIYSYACFTLALIWFLLIKNQSFKETRKPLSRLEKMLCYIIFFHSCV